MNLGVQLARRLFPLAIATAPLLGCGTSIDYVPLNTPPRALAERSPDAVEMFTTAPPKRPYVEVGTIKSLQQAYSSDTTEAIYAKMRAEAGKRGCDGLVILGSNNLTVVSGNSTSVSSRTLEGYRASCIVYTEAPAAVATATTTMATATTTLSSARTKKAKAKTPRPTPAPAAAP
jgi:hypothetical protein